MIDLQHVTKTYTKNNKKAVDDLTLQVKGTMAGHPMTTERLEAQKVIGFVPDGNDLYDRLTGMEYLNFMADIYGVGAAQRKAHIEKYLDIFSLEDAINNQVRSYSKGMKQKLVVIGALIQVAEKLCTRIGVIDNGSLKAVGTLDELRSGEKGASLEDLFLELTDDGGEEE